MHHLLLALALVVLIGVLPWIRLLGLRAIFGEMGRLLGLRAISGEMGSTAAIKASIVTVPTIELWGHLALCQTAAAAERLEV